jgi:hypothetical protein
MDFEESSLDKAFITPYELAKVGKKEVRVLVQVMTGLKFTEKLSDEKFYNSPRVLINPTVFELFSEMANLNSITKEAGVERDPTRLYMLVDSYDAHGEPMSSDYLDYLKLETSGEGKKALKSFVAKDPVRHRLPSAMAAIISHKGQIGGDSVPTDEAFAYDVRYLFM